MTDTIALPLWAAAGGILVVLVLAAILIARLGSEKTFGLFAQVAVSLLLVGVAWLYVDHLETQARAEQRRAIEARASALTALALAPNSNLACLEAEGGNLVQEACQKVLYSGPEQISAALAYVGSRLDILRDIALLPETEVEHFASIRVPLARSVEMDRYGFVAQVLQTRDGCSPDACHAFDLVQNRDQLVANMRERAYDLQVVRHASGWNEKATPPPAVASQAPSHAPAFSPANINFPTAASIPPVSIMANEPGMPGQNGVDTTLTVRSDTRQEQRAQAPPRRPAQKSPPPPPRPPAQAAPSDPFPQPIAPPAPQATGAPAQIAPQ